jgi:hypothetical protein
MLPHSPGGLTDISSEIRNAVIAAREVPLDNGGGVPVSTVPASNGQG